MEYNTNITSGTLTTGCSSLNATLSTGTSYIASPGTTSVAISSGNVELSYTGNFAGNAVKIYKTYIPV